MEVEIGRRTVQRESTRTAVRELGKSTKTQQLKSRTVPQTRAVKEAKPLVKVSPRVTKQKVKVAPQKTAPLIQECHYQDVEMLQTIVRQALKERLQLERHLARASEAAQRTASGQVDLAKYITMERTNETLRSQLDALGKLLKDEEHLWLGKDASSCRGPNLRAPVGNLEALVKNLRDAAEKRKELEREYKQSVEELSRKENEIKYLSHVSEKERLQAQETIQGLQSKVRELQKKCELQNVRHEELMLEMAALRKAQVKSEHLQQFSSSRSSSENGDYLKNVLTSSLPSLDYSTASSGGCRPPPSSSHLNSSASHEIDHILSRIEQNNHILQELEKSRATVGSPVSNYNLERLRAQVEDKTRHSSEHPFFGKSNLKPSYSSPAIDQLLMDSQWESQMYSQLSKSPSRPSVMRQSLERLMAKLDEDNRILAELDRKRASLVSSPPYYRSLRSSPHLLTSSSPAGLLHSTTPLPSGMHHHHHHHHSQTAIEPSLRLGPRGEILGMESIDSVDLPGRGRVRVYVARYTYDPFKHSPNDNPESELHLSSGDFILIRGDMDEDGFFNGELLDGRKGLVPSNFVEKLTGEELFDFQASFLYGGGRDGYAMCPTPDMLYTAAASVGELCHLTQDDFHRMNDYIVLTDIDDIEEDDISDTEKEEGRVVTNHTKKVLPPQRLILERQLNKSILIGWLPSSTPVQQYDVYVDGVCRAKVKATARQRALIEGVDSSQPHRVSVRAATSNGLHSKDAACTIVIGKGLPLAPSYVKASHVTSTSAVISWLPSNSNFQHIVAVNSVEVKVVKPGIFRYTITGLAPHTMYRVSVRPKPSRLLYSEDKNPQKKLDHLTATVEFRTLPKGLPDPPVDIQLEPGPQDGTLLVTWLPVTINPRGTSNGAPVTGYAVFSGSRRLTEVNSPTGDHALINVDHLLNLKRPCMLTVRTKSGDHLSTDSLSCQVPEEVLKARQIIPDINLDIGQKIKDTTNVFNQMKDFFTQKNPQTPGNQMGRNHGGQYQQPPIIQPGQQMYQQQPMAYPQQQPQYPQQPYAQQPYPQHPYPQQQPLPHQQRGKKDPSGRHHQFSSPRPIIEVSQYNSYEDGGGQQQQYGRRGRRRRAGGHHKEVRWFVALFDYDPYSMSPNPDLADEELPFQEGQLIKVYGDKDADGFYQGELNGQLGFVPSNMVSEVQVEADGIVRKLNPHRNLAAEKPAVRRMVALYDYDPQELSPNVDSEMELSFKTGDIIFIHGNMDDDGFFMGELNGLRGLVPSNFLSEAPPHPQTQVRNQHNEIQYLPQGYAPQGQAPLRQPYPVAQQGVVMPNPTQETKLGAGLSALKNIFSSSPQPQPQAPPPQMGPAPQMAPPQQFIPGPHQQMAPPQQHPAMIPPQQHPAMIPPQQHPAMIPPQQHPAMIPPQQHPSMIPPQQHPSMIPPQQHPSMIPSQQHPSMIPPQQHPSMIPPQQHPPQQESKGLLSSVTGMFKGSLLKS